MSTLGQRIKELRTNKKMTQEDLGKILGVTKVSISGYENGTREPDSQALGVIAKHFNVSTDYLLGISNSKNSTKDSEKLLAAHIDDDLSEDELKQVRDFIDFLKHKKK